MALRPRAPSRIATLHRHDHGMSFRETFQDGYALSLPQPAIPGRYSGHPLRAAHFITSEQVMTIQGWHRPALCHCDDARRDCHRCRVYIEPSRAVRRRVGMFLATQGFSVSLEELQAVRAAARLLVDA